MVRTTASLRQAGQAGRAATDHLCSSVFICGSTALPKDRENRMNEQILINVTPQETRVAITEQGSVQELSLIHI